MAKEHLLSDLRGWANSLDNGWMDERAVMGSMLIRLESEGYLIKKEIHYIKEL